MSSAEEQEVEEMGFVPESARLDRIPSEIERAAKTVRERMMRIRENNNISPDHQEQQTIQLDPEWLDSIAKTLNDSARSVLLARRQRPTIYQYPDGTYSVGRSWPDVACIGPYHLGYCDYESSMQDYKWCCVHRLIE